MIHNIIFDMGNVIMHYDPPFFCRRVTSDPEEAEVLLNQVFLCPEWPMLDQGTITVEEFAARLEERVPCHLKEKAKELLNHWYVNLPVYSEMEELMAELKEHGIHLYLLSNAGLQFHTYKHHIPAFRHLDGIVISADILCTKPQAPIYEYLLNQYSLNADECLFIDDMKVNVEGAEKVGIHGYCYQDGDITRLRQYLKELNIL